MNNSCFSQRITLSALLFLVGCSTLATPMPTSTPQATFTSSPTISPTETATATPSPEVTLTASVEPEKPAVIDLDPLYTQEINIEYMGVQMSLQLITDKTSGFNRVTIGEKNFAEAWARGYFKCLQMKRYKDWGKKSFEEFMDTWSKVQKGETDPSIIDITVWANDVNTQGYKQHQVTIRPLPLGRDTAGVLSLNTLAIALVGDVTNITTFESALGTVFGYGTNTEGNRLIVYVRSLYAAGHSTRASALAKNISDFGNWLYKNPGGKSDSPLPDMKIWETLERSIYVN